MNKKVTTIAGIAFGISLVAGAGYSLYKYFTTKSAGSTNTGSGKAGGIRNRSFSDFIGSSLVKGHLLYGDHATNGLIGGGLYKTHGGESSAGG